MIMSARSETLGWLAQRVTAAILAVCVAAHLVTVIMAVQGGLTAREIVARTSGDEAWLAFYSVFILAAAIHAPIGLRAILKESAGWSNKALHWMMIVLFAVICVLGFRAVWGLYAFEV